MTNNTFKFNIDEKVYKVLMTDTDSTGKTVPHLVELLPASITERKTIDSGNVYKISYDNRNDSWSPWIREEGLISPVEVSTSNGFVITGGRAERIVVPELLSVNIKGINVPVIEHFKDIKKYCSNHDLFNRWYNRHQFLNAIIGQTDCGDTGDFGPILGGMTGVTAHYDWAIEVYDTADMTTQQLEWAAAEVGKYKPSFFLKDGKSGKIYFVCTDED